MKLNISTFSVVLVAGLSLLMFDLAWNLVRMGDSSGLEVLRHYLFRGEPDIVRAEAAMALGDIGEESDIQLLKKAAADKKARQKSEGKSDDSSSSDKKSTSKSSDKSSD